MIAETLAAILNGSGLAAMTASDGYAALETASLIPPDILITGLAMPGISGLELALEMTRRDPDCEVIVLSGHATASDLAANTAQAGSRFATLGKPVHPVDLLACVFEALGRKGCSLMPSEHVRCSRLYDSLESSRRAKECPAWAANIAMRPRLRPYDLPARNSMQGVRSIRQPN